MLERLTDFIMICMLSGHEGWFRKPKLTGDEWIPLFYHSISRQFQSPGEKSHTATRLGTAHQDYEWIYYSDEQAYYRRSSAIRQQCCCCRSCIASLFMAYSFRIWPGVAI